MNVRTLVCAALLIPALCISCDTDERIPEVKVSFAPGSDMAFSKTVDSRDITFTATRDWTLEFSSEDGDWLSFEKEEGTASEGEQSVAVTVRANNWMDREGVITLKISNGWGFKKATARVTQSGKGNPVIYFNDFDKGKISNTGTWPGAADERWRNESGGGLGNLKYATLGTISFRSNGQISNGSNSRYAGSGGNKLYFGTLDATAKTTNFTIMNLNLSDGRDYLLSFGAVNQGSAFTSSKFKVYLSEDNAKWVQVNYDFAQGGEPAMNVWDQANVKFSVPEGVTNLSVMFSAATQSVYCVDDVRVRINQEAGKALDFSKGTAVPYGTEVTSK